MVYRCISLGNVLRVQALLQRYMLLTIRHVHRSSKRVMKPWEWVFFKKRFSSLVHVIEENIKVKVEGIIIAF